MDRVRRNREKFAQAVRVLHRIFRSFLWRTIIDKRRKRRFHIAVYVVQYDRTKSHATKLGRSFDSEMSGESETESSEACYSSDSASSTMCPVSRYVSRTPAEWCVPIRYWMLTVGRSDCDTTRLARCAGGQLFNNAALARQLEQNGTVEATADGTAANSSVSCAGTN